MFNTQDTICALSTAAGPGAIAVIRISGTKAFEITERIFSKTLAGADSHTAHFGRIVRSDKSILDEVLLTVLHAGKSFTGEETVEIACHGSQYIQQELLKLLLQNGCRMAEAGEFTMRAFMNGKMDLSQAEAVADLIASESRKAHEIAMNQMRGKFSGELKDLREKLIHFASLVELELDFAEEDVEFADRRELKALVSEVIVYLESLISSFELGNAIKNGVPVAIVGSPNTGKSTLLNQLLGEERAIVSNIAGTTRDTIEEALNIDGILFRLIDTAGIREATEDKIEAIGIERSYEKIRQAQIALLLVDSLSYLEDKGGFELWAMEVKSQYPDKKLLVLFNKVDTVDPALLPQTVQGIPALAISAKHNTGITELKSRLVDLILQNKDLEQSTIVSNARHIEALEKALISLNQAKTGLEINVTGDFVAMDIRQAMFHIGSITGDISTDDLLGNIFSKFCIGK
ncbi:MAG: tRNA uridine-5-carboxymethylaminomethyl(34) synthesis GTPase MnmE [Crocinitomicaceae bacterium]|jgi:tRNA modification GTPase|nr:tRNA uridine-5-carboxymethylaminomethyl(34) synthesis GTPase MnmE [Crocinitomicaceae bacterium]